MNYYRRWQTPEDLERERIIREEVAAHWGLHGIKLGDMDQLDAVFTDHAELQYGKPPTILCVAEIKHRDLIFGAGWDWGYWIATDKMIAMKDWIEAFNVPCWLIIRFNDGLIRCARLRFPLPGACWAGRRDRNGDRKAQEPHAIIPWSWFKNLYDDTDNL